MPPIDKMFVPTLVVVLLILPPAQPSTLPCLDADLRGDWRTLAIFNDSLVIFTDDYLFSFVLTPQSDILPITVNVSRPRSKASIKDLTEDMFVSAGFFSEFVRDCGPGNDIPVILLFVCNDVSCEMRVLVYTYDPSTSVFSGLNFRMVASFYRVTFPFPAMQVDKGYIFFKFVYHERIPHCERSKGDNSLYYFEYDEKSFDLVLGSVQFTIPTLKMPTFRIYEMERYHVVFTTDLKHVYVVADLQLLHKENVDYVKPGFKLDSISAFAYGGRLGADRERVYILSHDDDRLYSFRVPKLSNQGERLSLQVFSIANFAYCDRPMPLPNALDNEGGGGGGGEGGPEPDLEFTFETKKVDDHSFPVKQAVFASLLITLLALLVALQYKIRRARLSVASGTSASSRSRSELPSVLPAPTIQNIVDPTSTSTTKNIVGQPPPKSTTQNIVDPTPLKSTTK